MRSRSWLFILVIGIGGMALMGLMTKMALESSPELLRIVKIKEALAEDLGPRGAREISMRSMPEGRGIAIRIEAPRAGVTPPEDFARSAAELFVRKYGGPAPALLKLSLVESGRFSCGGPATYYEKEYRTIDITAEIALREAIGRMRDAVGARKGFRLISGDPGSPIRVVAAIPPPSDAADLERSMEFLRAKAREHLAAGTAHTVILEARANVADAPASAVQQGAPGGGAVLREERIDRRGITQLRPSPAGAPSPAGDPGART